MLKSQESPATASAMWAGCASDSRIVVKAGTALLTSGGEHIDIEVMASLVGQIARLHSRGSEVLLVSSSGVLIRTRVSDISRQSRTASGVRAMALEDGEQVVAIAPVELPDIPDADESDDADASEPSEPNEVDGTLRENSAGEASPTS